MTAETSAADTNPSQNLRFVPYADLTELDPGLEDRSQILDKLAEIDPSVRGKIKQHFIVVKSIFRVDQLHFQAVFADLLLADLKGILLPDPVLPLSFVVVRRSHTKDFFQRMNHFILRYLLRFQDHTAVLYSPGSLHNNMVSCLHPVSFGIKIINFSHITESDAYYFCHSDYLSLMVRKRSSRASSKLTFALRRTFVFSIASRIFSRFS